jgi:hypothetical protein
VLEHTPSCSVYVSDTNPFPVFHRVSVACSPTQSKLLLCPLLPQGPGPVSSNQLAVFVWCEPSVLMLDRRVSACLPSRVSEPVPLTYRPSLANMVGPPLPTKRHQSIARFSCHPLDPTGISVGKADISFISRLPEIRTPNLLRRNPPCLRLSDRKELTSSPNSSKLFATPSCRIVRKSSSKKLRFAL